MIINTSTGMSLHEQAPHRWVCCEFFHYFFTSVTRHAISNLQLHMYHALCTNDLQTVYLLNGDNQASFIHHLYHCLTHSCCVSRRQTYSLPTAMGVAHVKKRWQECFHLSMLSQCTFLAEQMVCWPACSIHTGHVWLDCFSYPDSQFLCYAMLHAFHVPDLS